LISVRNKVAIIALTAVPNIPVIKTNCFDFIQNDPIRIGAIKLSSLLTAVSKPGIKTPCFSGKQSKK